MSDEQNQSSSIVSENTSSGTTITEGSAGPRLRKKRRTRKPVCQLCRWGCLYVDYKDHDMLRKRYLKNNKIVSHKVTGNCLKHQHQVATAIKRARIVALLPFVED